MLVIGVAFLVFAALIQFFAMSLVNAAVVTGVIFVLLGILVEHTIPSIR